MRLLVHAAAQAELDAAQEWTQETFGPDIAEGLHRKFEQAGRLLMRQPAIGTLAGATVRKLHLGKFPYSLVYRVQGELIVVIALAHESRKPGYWRGR